MTVNLAIPGDEVTLLVTAVELVASTAKPGTFRYQIDGFLDDGKGERTFCNKDTLDKQLVHKKITAEGMVGAKIRFWRKAAPNNTPASGYLNMDILVRGGAASSTKQQFNEMMRDEAETPTAQRPPAQAALPLADSAEPSPQEAIEQKRIARRKQMRTLRHQLWIDEARFQVVESAKLNAEYSETPGFVPIVPTAESISAASSTDFIQFNIQNLV